MATQQGVIKTFMASLDKTTLTGTQAVDEAVKACSDFGGGQEVINKMLADCKSYNNADSKNGWENFLLEKCGINLDNKDTGAITGSDAGGSKVKTATSVVPNKSFDTSFNDTSFTKRGVTFQLAYQDSEGYRYPLYNFNSLTDEEKHVWQGLYSFWAEESLKLIEESYDYSLNDSDSKFNQVRIFFVDDSSSSNYTAKAFNGIYENSNGKYVYVGINMHYFKHIASDSLDGKYPYWDDYYLDRLIAHELTHVVMNAKVNNFGELPSIIVEGLAELTVGMDDSQDINIKKAVASESMLKNLLVLQEDYNEVDGINNEDYVAGYIFLRYLAKQAASQGKNVTNTKSNTTVTGTNQADTIENYGSKSKINALAGNDFIGSYAANSSVNAGDGNDTIMNTSYGTNTTLIGGAGNDSIRNSANAKIYGGAGADTITNTDLGSNSTLSGGAGNDYITTYNANKVSINGGDGNDRIELRGTGKYITLTGGKGNDTVSISGGTALIQYKTGEGNDSIVGFNASSTLQIGGGTGTYSSTTKGKNIIVTVGEGKITLQGAAKLPKVNIAGKKVITNNKNNASVIGSNYADSIENYGSKSKINALAGKDFIGSYAANSSVNAGAGNDTIRNTSYGTNTTLIGGAGNDSIRNSANAKIYGGAGDDTITNTDLGSNSTLSGGADNDYITSYNADKVSINGGDGNDTIFLLGTSKGVTISGGKGNDTLWGDNGANTFLYSFGDGKDIIYGFDDDDILKITGKFSGTYSKAKDEISFKVGTTTSAITLKDYTATSFNVNGAAYKISGSKLVKK